ncbi:MAG: amidohydrolase family protein, partial [Planctomycetota bacterium]
MLDLPITDTHLHLWDPGRLCYPWLAPLPALNRPFSLADFDRACAPVRVARMVFVQCECEPAQAIAEMQWVAALAAGDQRLRGIVAFAPLEQGAEVASSLAQISAEPLVKGIRRIIQFESDLAFCVQPRFIEGVRLLARFDLSFDLCISHGQLANTIHLVRSCPQVRFMLDHIGKPDIKTRQLEPWRTQLRELAREPNVWCKLSGLVTEADHARWRASDLRPYVEHVVDCFGFDRLVFGGDWPVATLASSYPQWCNALAEILADASAAELERLWRSNATRF